LILLGSTSSSNYPLTTNAFDNTFNGGASLTGIPLLNGLGIAYPNGADIVITKFNASGGALIGSTYFGGSGTDGVGTSTALVINYGDCLRGEILVDSNDNVYIATISSSTNLPNVTNSLFKTNAGGFDGIIAKFNTNLSSLVSFSYLGGAGDDAIYDMAFDNNYNIVATGGSNSLNFPTTPNLMTSCSYYALDMNDRGDGTQYEPFSQTYLPLRTFKNEDYTYENSYDVLDKIVRSFGCRLFQAGGKWWIVAVNEFANTSNYFTQYNYLGAVVSSGSNLNTLSTIQGYSANKSGLYFINNDQIKLILK
jgi:hypothetical protein